MFGFGKIKDEYDILFGKNADRVRRELEPAPAPPPTASAMVPTQQRQFRRFDGEKFPGGFGPTQVLELDYWELRARSSQLFRTNLYARGIIRRLVTNEINTGLHLEATPEERILGVEEDSLSEWAEDVETRWELWAQDPFLCDHFERQTFGALQAAARAEALISGDCLVVIRQDQRTGLPRLELVSGWAVQTPFGKKPTAGNRIVHGVELDAQKRHVAYWIAQDDGKAKRLPAFGEKSGRRLAWMIYGTDRRLDDVRGEPLLAIILQSLKEIDRYRDSVQRKATVNSMLAMFIKKLADKPGTLPMLGGAVRAGSEQIELGDGKVRSFNVLEQIPGVVIDELQTGEEPVAYPSNGTDEKFGDFEESIIQACAWNCEIPPEILQLSFSSNYSASQAAINEFKIKLNLTRTRFGEEFCSPIYQEWLLASVLQNKIQAAGFLEAWRDAKQYDIAGAWVACDWSGHIKPAVDMSKLVNGYVVQLEHGLITYDRAAREINGSKFSKNVKKMAREALALVKARAPLVEQEKPPQAAPPPPPNGKEDPAGDPDQVDEEDDSAEALGSLRVA